MGLIQEEEEKRYFIQLALQGGKEWWSQTTQYIQDKEVIPFYENFCYVLALVSSKQKENAEKAQELLHRLLQFQITLSSHCSGAFPKYLHQYPYAKDYVFQRDLLLIMEELLEHHSLPLGRVLTGQLKRASKKLRGYLALQEINEEISIKEQMSSKKLSSYLLFLRFTNPSLMQQMIRRYSCYWNPSLMCYTGPLLQEYYEQSKFKSSCFDYFMSSYYHIYPCFLEQRTLLQLQGALIPYCLDRGEFTYGELIGEHQGMPFSIWNTTQDSLFFFKSFQPQQSGPGLHLMRYLWKSQDVVHHCVCQAIHMEMSASYAEGETSLIFTYPQEMSMESSGQMELEFFVDYHPEIAWSIGHKKATVFYVEDKVLLHTRDQIIEFIFSIEEGKGDVIGHIHRGNRPSQIDPKASKEHEAFDWKLSLRTLRRDANFKVKLQMIHKPWCAYSQIQDCLEKLPLHASRCPHTE